MNTFSEAANVLLMLDKTNQTCKLNSWLLFVEGIAFMAFNKYKVPYETAEKV